MENGGAKGENQTPPNSLILMKVICICIEVCLLRLSPTSLSGDFPSTLGYVLIYQYHSEHCTQRAGAPCKLLTLRSQWLSWCKLLNPSKSPFASL